MVNQAAVGRNFTPVTATVEPGRLRYFLNTLGECNPGDSKQAHAEGYASAPVPPTYLFCLEMMDAERPFKFLTELNIDLARVLIPLGRGGTPEEAADAVYLFCSPESNYISGQVIVCGGGLLI